MKELPKCSALINQTSRHIISNMISGSPDETCGNNARYLENDEWYCGRHAPSKIQEREDKAYKKWKASVDAKKKK